MYSVYIKLNKNNEITHVQSDTFLSNTTNWIKIDEGKSLKYLHAQNNYFNKPIMTESGVYRYKYIDNTVIELSEEEIAEKEALLIAAQSAIPSQLDIIEAQIIYTAMMTNTLLS